jgi:hypothetical protein
VVKTRGVCVAAEAIGVRRKGARAEFTVDCDALSRQSPGWLASWSAKAEEDGCVPPDGGLELAGRVLSAGPLGLNMPYRLLHADQARSGYLDLGPETRLQVVTPIGAQEAASEILRAEGSDSSITVTAKSAPGLIGVETAWYAVRGNGIVPLRAEARIGGEIERRTGPARNLFEGFGAGTTGWFTSPMLQR